MVLRVSGPAFEDGMTLFRSIREFLRGSDAPRCSLCKNPIRRTHRFRVVHHRFLWFRWETRVHRDCNHPHMEPKFETKPIPGREFCNLFGPSLKELARSIHEDGK